MDGCIFKCTTMPDGHRANSIRPYHGQAISLMFGAYNDDKMLNGKNMGHLKYGCEYARR